MLRSSLILGSLLAVALYGCGDQPADSGDDPTSALQSSAGPDRLSEAQMQQWLRSCALCHVTGVGGAPLVGNVEQWQERVEQGRELLLAHTIEGFNAMPPLGYCMSCEREDFSAMIDFMAGDAQ